MLPKISVLTALPWAWLLFPISAVAQGDLFLSPTRIIFEGSDRTQEVLVVNTGQDSAHFTVSFIEYHIDEAGNYHPIQQPEPDGYYASRFVRFYPRKFALAPNASQTLRLQYLPKPGMAEGEYRSHLFFRTEAPAQQRSYQNGADNQQLSVRLTPVYGVTIPVLIREGTLSSETAITDIRLDLDRSPQPLLEFAIRRYGDKSTSGDLSVDIVTPAQQVINILTQKGVALYTSSELRKFSLPLDLNLSPENLRQGTLLIRYGSKEQAGEALSSLPVKMP